MKKKYLVAMLIDDESGGRDCEDSQFIEAESLEDAIRIYNERKKKEGKKKDMSNGYHHSAPEPLSTKVEWKEVDYEGD